MRKGVVGCTIAFMVPALLASVICTPAAEKNETAYSPPVAAASDEAQQAIKRFRMPKGMQANVFAAEPMLANPVSFCFDEKGRCYVAETYRIKYGVTDNREHMYWLDDDLASRTVEDRVAMYKKWLKDKFSTYEIDHDRIRLIEDTRGNGVADKATVFSDDYYRAAEGLGAGVLARKGTVWYTCIPNLWQLRDTKGTGKADQKKSLSYGYGVHVAFLGHDLHGLRFGPDGKLYFSCGDRGLNVRTEEGGTLFNPDSGAVLRCNPDGSELEIVATGLRNPQELAFDQYGNLFTVDNNSDSGDKARLVYIVEGGDSGWRTGYQYDTAALGSRGPFNYEKLWHLPHEGQPAYIVPPLAHIADGPSGLCYNPGVSALPDAYANHFFVCDFRGDASNSGVRSFAVKPKGASFEMVDAQEFIWSILATDCDFGPDGAFYISDWVHGWDRTGKGRIYRFGDPELMKKKEVAEVKKLLAEGFEKRSLDELARLLEHPDMRIRQEAQFALVDKGAGAIETLKRVAFGDKQLARIHAIWGLGQMESQRIGAVKSLRTLLADRDPEIRAQTAKILGDTGYADRDKMVLLLGDAEPRVQFFAALALGKQGGEREIAPLFDMIRRNADKDAYLRHAAVVALSLIGRRGNARAMVMEHAKSDSAAERMAVLLTLRRWDDVEIVQFLSDPNPQIVAEAARAIYDVPLNAGMPALAKLVNRDGLAASVLYRVLNANVRLGEPENAAAVASFAANAKAPEALRLEALQELAEWSKPAGRDRVMGLWRPVKPRDERIAANAVRAALGGIMGGPPRVRQEGAKLAAKFGIKEIGPALLEMVADGKQLAGVRTEALKALDALKDERVERALKLALEDKEPRVRTEGRRLVAKRRPAEAVASLGQALEDGPVIKRQGSLAILAEMNDPAADALLGHWMDKLLAKQVPAEIQLDLLEAVAKHPSKELDEKRAKFEAARPKDDHLAKYRETLAGGDAEAGRRIFLHKQDAQCLKCHKLDGVGGEVGPELKGIGSRQTREYLLESIVEPSRQIAKGYESVRITTTKGRELVGIIKAEDDKEMRLMTPEGQLLVIPKEQIDERRADKSAMPEDLIKYLSKAELRDLVEFLAGLK